MELKLFLEGPLGAAGYYWRLQITCCSHTGGAASGYPLPLWRDLRYRQPQLEGGDAKANEDMSRGRGPVATHRHGSAINGDPMAGGQMLTDGRLRNNLGSAGYLILPVACMVRPSLKRPKTGAFGSCGKMNSRTLNGLTIKSFLPIKSRGRNDHL